MKGFLTFLYLLCLTSSAFAQGFANGNGYDNGLSNQVNNNGGGFTTDGLTKTTTTYNVGVGSTNPGVALDVNGTVRLKVVAFGDGTSQSTAATAVSGANPTAAVGTSAVNGVATTYLRSDGAPAINLTMSPSWTGNHTFAPSSGNTVFTSGNVGIGTTLSTNKLDIAAGTAIGATYAGYQTAPTNGLIVQGNVAVGTNAPNNSMVFTAGNTNPLSFNVDANGNIGVGTVATNHLFVAGPTASRFVLDGSGITVMNNTTVALTTSALEVSATAVNIGNLSAGSTAHVNFIAGGGANSFYNFSSGVNVGINSTSPGQLLDVLGTARISNGGFYSAQTTAPTVGSNACGSTAQGTVVASSSNLTGNVTVGTAAVTSCAVTWNGTLTAAPNCICMDDSNVLAIRCASTATTLTITSLASMSGDIVTWWCPSNK